MDKIYGEFEIQNQMKEKWHEIQFELVNSRSRSC